MAKKKRPGLGALGVDALLSSTQEVPLEPVSSRHRLQNIALKDIVPSKYQPRQHIDQQALQELAESLKSQGLIQPVVVRPSGDSGSKFELIAGERRWRAAGLADLESIPAIVRDLDENAAAVCALIENIQREDLNPLEEAAAMQKLITHFDLTHDQLAETLGRSRPAITNTLRLLKLDERVAEMVSKGLIEMGHARTIVALNQEDQLTVALEVSQKAMTVRQTEDYVANLQGRSGKKAPQHTTATTSPELKQLQRELSEKLHTTVTIEHKKSGNGKVRIDYANLDVLEGILSKIR